MVYIQEEALTLKNELGQGEFGSVLKGTYRTPEGIMVRKMMYSIKWHLSLMFVSLGGME